MLKCSSSVSKSLLFCHHVNAFALLCKVPGTAEAPSLPVLNQHLCVKSSSTSTGFCVPVGGVLVAKITSLIHTGLCITSLWVKNSQRLFVFKCSLASKGACCTYWKWCVSASQMPSPVCSAYMLRLQSAYITSHLLSFWLCCAHLLIKYTDLTFRNWSYVHCACERGLGITVISLQLLLLTALFHVEKST